LRSTRNWSSRSRGNGNKQQPAAKQLPQLAATNDRHLPKLTTRCHGELPPLAAFCPRFDPPNQYPS